MIASEAVRFRVGNQRLWWQFLVICIFIQTALCKMSPLQKSDAATQELINSVMSSGFQTADYYRHGNSIQALRQHEYTKQLLQRLPPNAAIRCALALQALFPLNASFPSFIAEYSEIGFTKAILSSNAEAAMQLLGQTAAIYWTTQDFSRAMPLFLQLGDFVEPLIMINPADSPEDINRQSLFTKDFLRRYIRFMYNTHMSIHRRLCDQHDCTLLAWKMTEVIKSRLFRAQLLRSRLHQLGVMQARRASDLLEEIRTTMIKRNIARYTPETKVDVTKYDQRLVTLKTELTNLLPEYKSLIADAPSPQQLSQQLTKNETFLSFLYTDNLRSVYVWKIELGHANLIKLPAETLRLYISITAIKAYLSRDPSIGELTKVLSGLYAPLLGPLRLQSDRRLIIGVDQNLSALPFDAVPQPNGRLMMDDYDIVYTPSATVFSYLRNKAAPDGDVKQTLDYLGFSYISDDQSHADEMEAEVQAIAAKFPHASFKTHAKESDLYQQRQQFGSARYVHILAHNVAVPGHNGEFYLSLGEGNGEDGRLTSDEIVNHLQNQAALIVLSACETAPAGEQFEIGEFVPLKITLPGEPEPILFGSNCICSYGESFSGLSGSFFAAGAHLLLVTQWQIPKGRPTTEFESQFFDSLSRGKQPAEALKVAKLQMRQAYSPASWAGFILVGN